MLCLTLLLLSTTLVGSLAEMNTTWEYDLKVSGLTTNKEDGYKDVRFYLPPLDKTAYIIGVIPKPNISTLHHMILSGCDSSFSCSHFIYAWAHGGSGLRYPPGVGYPIGPGSKIKGLLLNMHYLPIVKHPDYSGLTLVLTSQSQPRIAGVLLMLSTSGTIPPGRTHYSLNVSCVLRRGSAVTLMGIRAHAHGLSRAVVGYRVTAETGHAEFLGRGNPQWPQSFYPLQYLSAPFRSLDLTDKHVLLARCVYDSLDQKKPVSIGSTHNDEMCNLYMLYHTSAAHSLQGDVCMDDEQRSFWAYAPADASSYASDRQPTGPSDGAFSLLSSPDDRPRPGFKSPNRLKIDSPHLGQVASVAAVSSPPGSNSLDLLVLHRGSNTFDDIDSRRRLQVDVVLHVSPSSGQVKRQWGKGLFVVPHSITVTYSPSSSAAGEAGPAAVWITDVGLNQVLKFDWEQWSRPSLILGLEFQRGKGKHQFCQPTDVAVSSTGDIFVSDGYCNARIVKLSSNGTYLMEWPAPGVGSKTLDHRGNRASHETREGLDQELLGADFDVVHSLTMIPGVGEEMEQVCAADRENAAVFCYTTNGRLIARYAGDGMRPSVYAIEYSSKYGLIFGITGFDYARGSGPHGFMLNPVRIRSLDDIAEQWGRGGTEESQRLVGFFSMRGLTNPHDLTLTPGHELKAYISQIGPNDIYEFTSQSVDAEVLFTQSLSSSIRELAMQGRILFRSMSKGQIVGLVLLLVLTLVLLPVCLCQCCRATSRYRSRQRQGQVRHRPNGFKESLWSWRFGGQSSKARRAGFRPLIPNGEFDGDYGDSDGDEDCADENESVILRRGDLETMGRSEAHTKQGNGWRDASLSRVPLDKSTRPLVPTSYTANSTCSA